MSDDKFLKDSELGESFSDLMKKVVEKQLEEENALNESIIEEAASFTELEESAEQKNSDSGAKPEETVNIVKPEETVNPKPFEAPSFDWKEEPKKAVEDFQPVSEVGVISSMTTINGTVSSKGHIRIEGNVIGDVFAYGDIKVSGKVAGDVEGANLEFGGCIVEGDSKARGDINVGKDSTLSGNVSGQLLTIDGKIKGDVTAEKGAHMSSSSLVKGSITAPTLSMSAGAELQGRVNVAKDDII